MSTVLDFNNAKPLGAEDITSRARSSVDVEDIRARLHANPRAFVEWLFSGRAFCTRKEARIGDTAGSPGGSLSISLAGKSAGLWHDHNTGEKGDLIGLYMAYMGYGDRRNFTLALKEIAAEFLKDPVKVERPAWDRSATERIDEKKFKLGDKPRAEYIELGAPVATWKYRDAEGSIIASVERYEPDGTPASKTYRPWCHKIVDGRLKWVMGAPDLRPLYNLGRILTASHVVLVEGEKCAQALIDIGIDATTAMQGAMAPVEKTDWSPLRGKTVTIWPDNDEAGLAYARAAAAKLATMGCTVLGVTPPAGKPEKWDAADCIAENGDPRAILDGAGPVSGLPKASKSIKTFNFADLILSDVPEEPDYIEKNLLGPGGFLLIGGPPKAQKSWLLQDILVSCATGHSFLSGTFAVPRPLRVFWLQAEMNEKLLRRRSKAMIGLSAEQIDVLSSNLIVSDRFRMILDEGGVREAVDVIKNDFPTDPPDMLAFDPMANLFDQENENDNAQVMKFLTTRIEAVRQIVNPLAGVILVHHATKKGPDEIRRDPFNCFRGGGALRGHYDSGMIIFRKSEDGEDREVHFELRGGETPDPITVRLVGGQMRKAGPSVLREHREKGWPDKDTCRLILAAIETAWRSGKPWSSMPQTRKFGRYAPELISRSWPSVKPQIAVKMVEAWLMDGVLEMAQRDSDSKLMGLKLVTEVHGGSTEVPF